MDIKRSQMGLLNNVRIRVFDKSTHKIISEHKQSNNVTKRALQGIVKFIDGQFNTSMINYFDEINKFIPRFVALGIGATSEPTVQDVGLNHEFTIDDVKQRVKIDNSDVISQISTKYVTLTFRTYISDSKYDSEVGESYNEFGLFTDETSNSLWARVKLDTGVVKTSTQILEITWEITVISPSSVTDTYEMAYNYEFYDGDNIIHTYAVYIEENELRVNSQSNGVDIDQLLGELEITTDSTGTIDTITLTKDGNVITLYSAE